MNALTPASLFFCCLIAGDPPLSITPLSGWAVTYFPINTAVLWDVVGGGVILKTNTQLIVQTSSQLHSPSASAVISHAIVKNCQQKQLHKWDCYTAKFMP